MHQFQRRKKKTKKRFTWLTDVCIMMLTTPITLHSPENMQFVCYFFSHHPKSLKSSLPRRNNGRETRSILIVEPSHWLMSFHSFATSRFHIKTEIKVIKTNVVQVTVLIWNSLNTILFAGKMNTDNIVEMKQLDWFWWWWCWQ